MRVVKSTDEVRISFELNGEKVTGRAEPRMLLTDFLRHEIGATGTHVGCEHGVCGCCTVRIDGVAQRGCLTLAIQADGRKVDTVEGLANADGSLSIMQAAFRRNHALQCGFCTAGILNSFADFFARVPNPTDEQILEVLSGHICRCTGYAGLLAALREAADEMRASRDAAQ
jgi:2-furoyl-CoA dehydrogenase 2Fe-2S iron sulfur subunit